MVDDKAGLQWTNVAESLDRLGIRARSTPSFSAMGGNSDGR
jgi:hypothetical protein